MQELRVDLAFRLLNDALPTWSVQMELMAENTRPLPQMGEVWDLYDTYTEKWGKVTIIGWNGDDYITEDTETKIIQEYSPFWMLYHGCREGE